VGLPTVEAVVEFAGEAGQAAAEFGTFGGIEIANVEVERVEHEFQSRLCRGEASRSEFDERPTTIGWVGDPGDQAAIFEATNRLCGATGGLHQAIGDLAGGETMWLTMEPERRECCVFRRVEPLGGQRVGQPRLNLTAGAEHPHQHLDGRPVARIHVLGKRPKRRIQGLVGLFGWGEISHS
jgi:hypothetical protein